MNSQIVIQLGIMTSEINFSTIKAQETYDRLKRCLDLSEDLLQKLNGHASSKNKVPQNIVKVYGQSETEIINEIDSGIIADEVPEPVESEIVDVKKDADDESSVEIELETVTENNDLQSENPIDLPQDAVSEEESTEQTILSGESTDSPKPTTDLDETAEDIVERAIQDALEEKQEKKEPTKADLKENKTDESEFIFQKDQTDEKIDFENVEKFGKENEEDIKENVENGDVENQASSIADAENEFDKNRRETLADVSEISNLSSSPKSVQESDEISENSENDEIFPVIIDETLSEKSDGSPVTGYIKAGLVIGFSGLIALKWGSQ
ncbi:unnamed protein product [Oikopleura dioica]|uniref:Uncharacterized protein n=1 Tax=Oikopleura dioica TaxID=34765 RepID=E4X5M0_OIKDI|nr:unnamed protein product [Oikopleura dioica]